jgi:hypothetical protein
VSTYPDVAGPEPDNIPALKLLLEKLGARHGDALGCALLYGSCLRSGDIFDGLLDLYLVCDDYRSAYERWFPAAANWVLPPNVFYEEVAHEGQILRSKVTLISLHDFRRGCSRPRKSSTAATREHVKPWKNAWKKRYAPSCNAVCPRCRNAAT